MSRYMNLKAVKDRLAGKIRFADPGDMDPNKMGTALFTSLINEAETQLEIDLMMRYATPLVGPNGTFEELPDTTKLFIRTLAELMGTVRLLETDFGRGTSVNGDKYTEKLQKRYDSMVKSLMDIKESDKKSYQTWLRPPLPGLQLAYNNQGDSGFRGRILHSTTTHRHADYAYKQINSPGEDIWTGLLDHLDHN